MRTMIITLLFLIVSDLAIADIIKFETNDFAKKVKLTWCGVLQKIDLSSQVAYFTYRNGSKNEEFQVHITRIYSLTLDDQDRVDKPFPSTLQDLKTPLPTDSRFSESIELTNENFVGDDIPNKVKVRPDRKSPIIYLSGTVKSGDLQKMLLEAKAENQQTSEFEIRRFDLVKWIRGR